ncbi:calmodulin, putative [Paecilomyces variotii No. 5]|uniref:Calmodulin, putative n=1 Tax=Byssochlamys spectabilis (strain No. 5 / NBRC 109023) TaxID=1356009 RepID=V5HSX4_BYSSN|nr:calmodulin, putative [Paecilomyces variotii No. 5]
MVTPNGTYKPSPLSFGSPRASPFRRPSTPNSPSTIGRPTTPGSSPGKGHTPIQSPSKLNQSYTAEDEENASSSAERIPQPKFREPPASPTPSGRTSGPGSFSSTMGAMSAARGPIENDSLSRLPPAQLREMREAFQVLDRDNDGIVNREDVADVLRNLGQDSSSAATGQYFPPGSSQTINLPTFLNSISTLLAPLSSSQELLNALAAFDDDDSGQIDVAELRDALLHTSPEAGESPLTEREIDDVIAGFTGRRAFGRTARGSDFAGGAKKGEVFRYQEFVASVMGGTDSDKAGGKSQVDAMRG